MTSLNPDYDNMEHAIKNALGIHWRMFMFEGVTLIILGILAIAAPQVATIAVDVFIGWLFLVAGIVGFFAVFSARDIASFLWSLVPAALSIAVGGLLLWKPAEGAVSLTVLLIALFIVEGVFQIVASIAYRDVIGSSWGWILVSGICDLILAAIIIFGWPITAAWTLGLLVGINLITSGVAIVMAAFAGRDVAGKLGELLQ
ncbi:MAG: HdeD family acid-resistance protein [Rhodomicrobium sp.]